MSLTIPCSQCGHKDPGKNMHCTWAWYRADGERVAWLQKLCEGCAAASVLTLHARALASPGLCPVCGTDPTDTMDPVYATFYPPGYGKVQGEYPTCSVCAVEIRVRAQLGAIKREDRPIPSEGQGPSPQTDWRTLLQSMGIMPREEEPDDSA